MIDEVVIIKIYAKRQWIIYVKSYIDLLIGFRENYFMLSLKPTWLPHHITDDVIIIKICAPRVVDQTRKVSHGEAKQFQRKIYISLI